MEILKVAQLYAVPAIILIILLYAFFKNTATFDAFLEGAKEGMDVSIGILPPLIGLFTAITVLRASGAMDVIIMLLKPVSTLLGIPPELVPLAVLRPISGSASLAFVSQVMKQYGPDSLIGVTASTMMGSTETIFYTLTVYFGSVGIKKPGYTLVAALFADAAGVIASVFICRFLFS